MIPLLRRSIAQGRYVLLGVLWLLFAFQLIIIAQAAEVERSNAFASVANLMPGFMQRGLGSRAMLLATFRGTVTFGYFHPVVCILVAVLAMYFATEPAHEVEAGLVDLELARAVPRHRLVTRSLLVAIAAVAGATVMMATFARRWSTSFTTVGLVAVVAYMVDFIAIGWPPMRSIAWLSPFHYYPALSIVAGDASTGRNIAVLLAAGAVFVATAYWQFQRRDV